MNFIETLKSVGGVKACAPCNGKGKVDESPREYPIIVDCSQCHGTGFTIDLDPLLAKPDSLSPVVYQLTKKLHDTDAPDELKKAAGGKWRMRDFVVVGPQRASNLVYEVARQLGGTAVVAVGPSVSHSRRDDGDGECRVMDVHYLLSLPIPPDATVLFVTDRLDENEMLSIVGCVSNPIRWLPYVLALVSDVEELSNGPRGASTQKIISLYSPNKNR